MSGNSWDKGPVAWMARNHVAANLVVIVLGLGGVVGLMKTKQEVFPEFSMDMISIGVPYPGASPEETEQGIVLAIEEAVRGIDGVKRVTSTASEGAGACTVELITGADPDKVLADVKNAVDRISTFPENAERPTVKLLASRSRVISLIIAGDRPLEELHQIAEMARNDLLSRGGITQVDLDGIPPLEISVEIPRSALDSYGFTLQQVAAEIRAASVELPGGSIKTKGGEIMVRVADRRKTGADFANIIIRSNTDGSRVRLGDIATLRDDYAETDSSAWFNGKRAARITAYRIGSETPKDVSERVREYVDILKARTPTDVSVTTWQDDSELLTGRIKLLTTNAMQGFALVFLILAVFLRLRLAFWVASGIPISFLGTFFLMPALGISINMITLFAFIVTLGMVVDDAIVVGENIYTKIQEGIPKQQAVVEGTREMIVPVTFSILTTMAAFAPMLFIPGVMGKIFLFIPMIVILVLGISLVESFFTLPAHLLHATGDEAKRTKGPIARFQDKVTVWTEHFTFQHYKPFLERALRYRFLTMSIGAALLIVMIGLLLGGFLPYKFFPNLEGDQVRVSVQLPFGTPVARTIEIQKELEASAMKAVEANGGKKILRGLYSMVGSGPTEHRGPAAGAAAASGGHLLTIEMALTPSDERSVGAETIRAAWEKFTPQFSGLKSIAFKSNMGPSAGAAVDVLLSHADSRILEDASNELTGLLKGYSELTDFENSFSESKPQLDFRLLPEGRALGLTSAEIAGQIRNAFYGREAIREQRGRNEMRVMVRYPKAERESEFDIERMLIRTPAGGQVPISYVAEVARNKAPTSIKREQGKRTANVKAELKPSALSVTTVMASLTGTVLPKLMEKYPGLSFEMAGEQREQKEMMKSLGLNFIVALFVMYALIAIPFKSYLQPVIVMFAIPFGIVGAMLGHLLLGHTLGLISIMGLVALSGVVVNDSIVLVEASNTARTRGMSAVEAIVWAGTRRIRPIFLTSITTFLGLMPIILERSLQARFLVPMAISLGFGVMFATLITLLLVPALYMMIEDVKSFFGMSGETAPPSKGQAS